MAIDLNLKPPKNKEREYKAEVKKIQEALKNHSYYLGAIDGIVGDQTLKALAAFKRNNNLQYPTVVGDTTWEKLNDLFSKQNQSFLSDIDRIKQECNDQLITDKRQIAYILATVRHETAGTYKPIEEYGGRTKRYAPYYGRGYVQLTWKANYKKYSDIIGIDLVKEKHRALEPNIAAFILVHGFKNGTFTGAKLDQYINDKRCDFLSARRIINGMDKASLIAGYARQWLEKLD
jgi:predicted chitinase